MKTRFITILLMFLFLGETRSQNVDISLLRQINLERNTSLDPTFKLITDSAVPISIAVPLGVYGVGLLQKDKALKKEGLYIGASLVCAEVVTISLKKIVKRDRPFVTYPDIQKETTGGNPSFPSGHASAAFSTATSLSIAFPKWYVIVPSFAWASAVGYSRMDLGVHYPSDVLAGMIVGSGSALLSYKAKQWLSKKEKKPAMQ